MAGGDAATRLAGGVGVIDRGRIEYGWGVPNQLAERGYGRTAVLLPFGGGGDCTLVRPGAADAVFILESAARPSWTEPEPRSD